MSELVNKKDLAILAALAQDGKMRTGKIAKQTGIPATTVHNRIKRMEQEGVITKYQPVLNHKKIGLGLTALIFVTVKGQGTDQQELARQALKIAGVEKARILTGGYDLLLEARLADVDALNKLLIKELRKLTGIDKTQTMIVLENVA